jgi:response regulator RpfG family c-di-GMP phosphodiesterase
VKKLSDCRVLLVDDAKANLDILVEGLKPDHKLSLALNGEMACKLPPAHRRTNLRHTFSRAVSPPANPPTRSIQ